MDTDMVAQTSATSRKPSGATPALQPPLASLLSRQTGRDKDRERVRIFREQAELDLKYLAEVLQRHGLEAKWNQWTT